MAASLIRLGRFIGAVRQMDRARLLERLAQAEHHISVGELHMAKQQALIAELERDGHDTTQPRDLLATFRQSQGLLIEGRNGILKELADPVLPLPVWAVR